MSLNFTIVAVNGYRSADSQYIEDLSREYVTWKKTVVAQYEVVSCNIDQYTVFKHNRTTIIKVSYK
jgi:hypothetical protein